LLLLAAAAASVPAGDGVQHQLAKNVGLVSHEIGVAFEMPDDAGQRLGDGRPRP